MEGRCTIAFHSFPLILFSKCVLLLLDLYLELSLTLYKHTMKSLVWGYRECRPSLNYMYESNVIGIKLSKKPMYNVYIFATSLLCYWDFSLQFHNIIK